MFVVLGLIVAFILMLIFVRPGTRSCRWRADHNRDDGSGAYYRCAACGAEAHSVDGPPKTCQRR